MSSTRVNVADYATPSMGIGANLRLFDWGLGLVIPAYAGIQFLRQESESGFRRGDGNAYRTDSSPFHAVLSNE